MVQLDPSQSEFCASASRNIRLLAPAGCGKTLSLLHRCSQLFKRSGSHPRFLVVTFTKAAAAELKERRDRDPEFASVADHARITTLNAYGWQRIRDQLRSPNLLVNQADYHFAMLRQLRPVWEGKPRIEEAINRHKNRATRTLMNVMDNLKSMGFDHTRDTNRDRVRDHFAALEQQGLSWRIAEQFDLLMDINVLEPSRGSDDAEGAAVSIRQFYDRFFVFWREATHRLLEESTFTFEDQKYWTYLDLKPRGPEGKAKSQLHGAARYNHILVDEFQDINPLDLQLVKVLAERNQATLTIVGDDDQAIFEWRGASPEYILRPETYLGASFADYVLSVNYRSPRNIVDLSQKLIAHNQNRRAKKTIAAENADTAEIQRVRTASTAERLGVVTEIARSVETPGRVAVIGRLRRQLIPYEVYFAADGAPFKTATDLDVFFSSRAFDKLIKLLDIWGQSVDIVRPQQATDRVIDICDLIKLYPLNKRDRSNLSQYFSRVRPKSVAQAVAAIEDYGGAKLSGKTHRQLHEIAGDFIGADNVAAALRSIAKGFSGLRFDSDKSETDPWYIAPPLEQLAQIAEGEEMGADDLMDRLETAKSRLREYQAIEESGDDSGESVSVLERPLHLMTATRAKGKEFDTVILLDTVDDIWPYPKSTNDPRKLEAERRLFYVAFTRARRKVVMLTTEDAPISRFVTEMGIEL
ncbi:MAG: ATP-dependent helicase [Gammaproteobacteria bacterium]|nr:ATP-dependent helicase [Gammaproteobacteria bacterium]